MTKRLLVLVFLFHLQVYSQQPAVYLPQVKYPELFKTIPLISNTDPEWVRLLYSDQPNFYSIEKAYHNYYKSHTFQKTIHTQNYKNLCRIVSTENYVEDDGTIKKPTLSEEHQQEIIRANKLQHSARSVQSANFTLVGPTETYDSQGVGYKTSQLNVYTFDQSISNPNIAFAGGETGAIFKTTDKGENWFPIAEQINLGAYGAIAIDPVNENIIFVSDGSNKLWKSIDGGITWSVVHEVYQLGITDISIHGQTILTAGDQGLYRSTDSGSTWNLILSDKCWDIEQKTDDPNTVFVAKSNPSINRTEIWKSVDNGATFMAKTLNWWNPVGGVAANNGGARIGVTDADPNRIYVVLLGDENDANDDANYIGIYRSNNAGDSWITPYDGNHDGVPDNEPGGPYSQNHWCMSTFNPSSNGGYNQGFYNLGIAVSDTNPDSFLVGFLNLYKSEDGGVSYTQWGGYGCDNCGDEYRHPDIQEIEINTNDVWVCSDGGIDYYDVNLDFIAPKIKGLSGTNFWGIDQGWNEDVLVGGRYHNGNTAYYQSYGVGKFLSLGGGEAPTGYVDKAVNRRTHFSDITDKEIPNTLTGGLKPIPNYQLYPNQGYYLDRKSEIVTDPRYWKTLYLGKDNKLWKSIDGGLSFDLLKEFGTDTDNIVKGIEIARNNPNIIYLTQQTGYYTNVLWKSIDAGDTWSELTLPSNNRNACISIDEGDENTLFISFNNGGSDTDKIFKTIDGGVSWINLTTSTLDGETIKRIKTQAGTDGGIYIATDYNVYYKNNSLQDWQLFVDGLPLNRSPLKLMPFYKNAKIRFATFNRGVYESDFFESSKPIAQPMVASKVQHCASRGVQFEDFSVLEHQGASWLWSFPGSSSVSSASVRNPIVFYDTPGLYDVSLTVTDQYGFSDSITINDMVEIGEDYCQTEQEPLNAIDMSGSNSDIENTAINFTGISNFTFTGWVKPSGIQNDYSAIFSLGEGYDENKNCLNFRGGNNTLGMHWNGDYWGWDSNLIVPPDEWSFVAISVSPTQIKLFVNEESVTWDIDTTPITIDRIILGSYYHWGSRMYSGLLEEACVWKRTLTDDEIYLQRHLTKTNLDDADLIAYYQFNHQLEGMFIDKKNGFNLAHQSGDDLIPSTAPVGGGTSQLLFINTTGVYNFSNVDVQLNFTGNTVPNGKLVVSRLGNNPSNTPNTNGIDESYWVINNYGTNSTFDPLQEMTFSNAGYLTGAAIDNIKLFKRGSNSDTQTDWANVAGAIGLSENTGTVTFDATLISSFSQFYIGSTAPLDVDNLVKTNELFVYPNPVVVGDNVFINSDDKISIFLLYDNLGKEIYRRIPETNRIKIKDLSQGVYYYYLETDRKIKKGKLIVR